MALALVQKFKLAERLAAFDVLSEARFAAKPTGFRKGNTGYACLPLHC